MTGLAFGTDGLRGVANDDLTPEVALAVGRAAAQVLGTGRPYLIGRDTRLSGPMLEAGLVAGLLSAGAVVLRAGIVPTPAVAYLGPSYRAAAGIVISASHNPVEDNGIKVFGGDGFKLPDATEAAIERLLDAAPDGARPTGVSVGREVEARDAEDRYLAHLVALAPPLRGLRVVVDCAFGAAYRVAPRLWRELGAEVIALNAEPDGGRINVECGSTHPSVLQRAVREHRADLGFSHDGDADRVIAADEHGRVVDGDAIMGICALALDREARLPGRAVVATVMSNVGLEIALRRAGIALERTRVGDRYVLERMREVGAALGGEQSGHVIFLDHATTGDGLVTALMLARVMVASARPLSELAEPFERYPQVLLNVRVGDRARFGGDGEIARAVESAASRLRGRGRVVVRPSGTEPLIRVMVECESEEEATSVAGELVEVIRRRIG